MKAGVGDTISNYTALYDWKLGCEENSDRPNDFAYMLSETAFTSLLYSEAKSLTTVPGIQMLAQSLVLSGLAMQIAGNSRPCSGSEHLFCHAMDELFEHNIPHGILVALGSVVACRLQGRDHHILLDFLEAYDISVSPKTLNITEEEFIKAWMFAKEVRKRYTILNKINLQPEIFRQMYESYENMFGDRFLPISIRNCIAVNESNTTFEPLLSYDKKCPASLDYVELVNYLGLMDTAHYRKLARYLKGEK